MFEACSTAWIERNLSFLLLCGSFFPYPWIGSLAASSGTAPPLGTGLGGNTTFSPLAFMDVHLFPSLPVKWTECLLWTECLCPPARFTGWRSNFIVIVFGGGAFGSWWGVGEVIRVQYPWLGWCLYKEIRDQSFLSAISYKEKAAIHESGGQPSPRNAACVISGFQLSEPWEVNVCYLSHRSSLW